MEYSKIVAVSGMPGLFELINSKTDGAIVRSLDDKSTRFVSSRIHQFSHLESIEIYTVQDNVNLVDVLNAMDKAGGSLPDEKDASAVKKYFEKVFPDLDFERVYASDMKKMVKWYEVLKKNKVEIKLTEIEEEETEEEEIEEEKEAAPVKEKKAVKKAAPKKAAKASTEEKEEKKSSAEKKPAAKKKAPAKKK